MGRRSRSRSRSPKRDRRRSPGRDRDRERERRDRHRSRSPHRRRRSPSPRRRSPGRRRSRSRERDRVRDYDRRDREVVHPDNYNHGQSSRDVGVSNVQQQHLNNRGLSNRPSIDASAIEGKTEEEIEMMKVMGFGGFDTTKGKHIEGNDVYVANIQRKRRYRQYMNRRGGFNRPLDFIA